VTFPGGGFSFRQRFELAPGGRLPFDEERLVLREANGIRVELRSLQGVALRDSSGASIWGSGFPNLEAAREAGEQWRSAMQRAFAGVNLGANFGLRDPNMGGFTDAVLEELHEQYGFPVIRDSWDVLVFPSEPAPRFSSMTAEGHVTTPAGIVMAAIDATQAESERVNDVAFDLLTASRRSSHLADARVVLLVMALECLITRQSRPELTRHHLDRLISQTLESQELDPAERDVLANALRGLKDESTRAASRRLAAPMYADDYPDDPGALISEGFRMRHVLVHGGRRPDLDRVRYVGANLERVVADLIAGPVVTARVAEARLAFQQSQSPEPGSSA
jgi:hypothetical protein